jgi:hypothetical protein
VLPESSLRLPADHPWRRLPTIGIALAALGLGGALALGLMSEGGREQLWHSWLVGAMFVLTIGLGGLFFVLVHHATQAGWSVAVRRIGEHAMGTLPWTALLFVPLLLGAGDLFHWTHADAVASDHLLTHKRPYLNLPFFLVRNALYFAAWSGFAWWFGRLSRQQDESGDREITARLRKVSGPSLIVFALTLTFASFDWLMSLDPHWYSTIFGAYVFAGSAVAFFAFLGLVVIGAWRTRLLVNVVNHEHLQDIGKLLFAFVVFWAYMAFSQYMLIWYANLPEETGFFSHRLHGSWKPVSVALAVGHFVVPFFFLLPRAIKRSTLTLAAAASWMLLMHLVDLYWLVMPNLHPEGARPALLDAATLVGSVGVFLAAFGRSLGRHALVPIRDPRLAESLTFENV